MTLEMMGNIMTQLPLGYACHKISFSDTGEVQEIVLREANEAFFKLWALDQGSACGQKVSLVGCRTADSAAWSGLYEGVKRAAAEQAPIVHILESYYRVAAYYPAPGSLVTIYQDISREMRELEELRQRLAPGRTCCLLGSSGVGKTTLVNRLMGREAFETQSVSGTGEGRHTTTRRQLCVLQGGALLVDTPGMRELGIVGAEEGLEAGFEDISALSAQCRYADCRHGNEPGCAVRAALEGGELAGERYAHYLKLRKESEHNALSALDKRRKDKAFGRFVKSVKKHMRD